MSYIGVKQEGILFPTLIGLYIDEVETYLDEINGDSPCLLNTMVAIFFMLTMLFYYLNIEQAYKDL